MDGKRVFLVTHGPRFEGHDAMHTEEGFSKVRAIQLPGGLVPSMAIIGTGRRHWEIWEALIRYFDNIATQRSPFCGSADSINKDKSITLADGTVVPGDSYVGLVESPCFDAWKFVDSFEDSTFLLAGGELMVALGLNEIRAQAALYELDPHARTGHRIG